MGTIGLQCLNMLTLIHVAMTSARIQLEEKAGFFFPFQLVVVEEPFE
jgi:hypothetical protein